MSNYELAWDLGKVAVRLAFLAMVLALSANRFDHTEFLVIGFAFILEGAFLYWEYR